jgi:hypothetical protein
MLRGMVICPFLWNFHIQLQAHGLRSGLPGLLQLCHPARLQREKNLTKIMKAVNNTDLNINLDQDLVDFVIPGTRRWHGDRFVVLIAFIVYGFNYKDSNIKDAER